MTLPNIYYGSAPEHSLSLYGKESLYEIDPLCAGAGDIITPFSVVIGKELKQQTPCSALRSGLILSHILLLRTCRFTFMISSRELLCLHLTGYQTLVLADASIPWVSPSLVLSQQGILSRQLLSLQVARTASQPVVHPLHLDVDAQLLATGSRRLLSLCINPQG